MFLEIFQSFQKVWEIICSKFLNYLVQILWMKLFQEDFGKTDVKLPVKS